MGLRSRAESPQQGAMATRDAGAPSMAGGPGESRWRTAAAWLEDLAEAERDQFPLWLPVALLTGIAAWFWLPDRTAWIAFIVGMAALMLGALAGLRGSRWGPTLIWFAGAAIFGCALIWW